VNIMNAPLGTEPPIEWLDRSGQQRPDWIDTLPPSSQLSPDDAVWPADLQEHKDFFRRRGSKLSDSVGAEGFVKGDFGALRQLVAEYLSTNTTPQINTRAVWQVTSIKHSRRSLRVSYCQV